MTVGQQASTDVINARLTSAALNLRGACQQIVQFQTFVTGLGTAGLEALGYSAADAANVVNQVSFMDTVAAIYYGTATQGTTFDFDNELSQLWAGQ